MFIIELIMQHKLKYLIPLFLFFQAICFGQSQHFFKKINQSNGLSNNRITAIAKQENGFVWIGTKNGLNRYDGKQTKLYNKQNSTISSNDISDILIDNNERIWITTLGGGLNLYNSLEDNFTVYKNEVNNYKSIPSNQINTIFEDANHNLWIGTENGLSLFNDELNNFKTYSHQINNSNSLSSNSISSIYEDSEGIFWIGTYGGGLNRFDINENKIKRIASNENFYLDFIHEITILDNDNLLIGTSGGGLLSINTKTLQFSKFFKNTSTTFQNINIVRSIKKDNNGTLWVGTDGNGLIKVENPNSENRTYQNYLYNSNLQTSISGNAIYEIIEDEHSNIWIGTAWNGISILNQENVYELLFSDIIGENPLPVLSIYKNKERLFLGLDGNGITAFEPKTKSVNFFNKQSYPAMGGNYIQYITESKNGIFWLGTFANGLLKFNATSKEFKQYKYASEDNNSISYNDVRDIIKDKHNNFWIATWGGGLNYFDTKTEKFSSFRENKNDENSISSDNVISIQKDGDKLWLATFGGGVDLFDMNTQKFTHFAHDEKNSNTIGSNNILSILKDSKNNLWIGTSGDGVNRYNIGEQLFDKFEEYEDLRYSTITAIIEDNNGVIWFSSKHGIFNFDYETNSFNSFPNLSGEFHINSVFKDTSGMLYFGGINGVLKFDPNTLTYLNKHPKVVLTNFKLFNKNIQIGENEILKKNIVNEEEVVLNHHMDVITFEFAALEFPFSTNCEYAIKMKNFDEDWRNIGKDRTATYTNLSPGNYVFKVKSRENGSSWDKAFTSIKVKILKPFWLQWWAFLIYSLLIIGAFYLFRKYIIEWERLKSSLALEKITHHKDTELFNLKQQFFNNVSHEIRTPVTLILGSISRFVENGSFSQKQQNSIDIIKKNSNHLLQLVNELLDFRKLEYNQIKLKISNDNLVEFCKEIYLSFTELAVQKNIKFTFETSSFDIELWYDKNQMEKVLYNLLSNAFKFTKNGGDIHLKISEYDKDVNVTVTDSGIGIKKSQFSKIFNRFQQSDNLTEIEEEGFGLGLSITKQVIELHQGEIFVESKKGFGTTFTFKLLKGTAHLNKKDLIEDIHNSELIDNYFIDADSKSIEEQIIADDVIVDLKGQTILIVEDNTDIRNYLVELLQSNSTIFEAPNGREALRLAQTKLPDLIISDVMMPVMDGITLTRKLKSDIRTSHIPIILLTARASFMHKTEGFDIGADDYITKPFNELLLQSRINNLLKSRKLLRQKFNSEFFVPIDELEITQTDQTFLKNLIEVIKTNIDFDDLNAKFVSKELHMSHSVMYKKIKAITGLSFVEFVRDYKMKTAKQLIAEQHFSVSEACYKVGYSDRKYFSKLFKQQFGKNPSEYLNKKL